MRRHQTPGVPDPIQACFADIGERERSVFARLTTPIHVGPDTVLMRQGAFGNEAVIMLSGVALVERDGIPVALAGAGAALGEHALLSNEPRNATVVTVTDAVVAVMTPGEFAGVLEACPTIRTRMLDQAASRA